MILRISLALLFFSSLNFLHAEKAIPYLSSPVIDDVGLLKPSERQSIEALIRSHKDLLQMQVWITRLEGESVEGLSYRAAREWALGTEKRDNGILLLIAPAEKRMRIEVGRGLEGDIPDILAGRILDGVMRPRFREGRYEQGIREALEQVVVLAAKGPQAEELKRALSKSGKTKKLPDWAFVVILIFFIIINIMRRFSGGGSFRSGRYSHGGFWGGGSSGWSSGGGGGWSGGGGSFGGGGSSSSW